LESPAAVEVEAGLSPPPPFLPRPTPVPVAIGYDDHSESEDDQDSVKLEIVDSELVNVEEVGVEENESIVKDCVGVLAGVVGLDVEEELLEIGAVTE
jgi:fructose/tagatose bisphosphate aldolase